MKYNPFIFGLTIHKFYQLCTLPKHWVLLQLLQLVKSTKLHIVIYIPYVYIKQVSSLSLTHTHTINFKAALCTTQFVAKGRRQFKKGVKN
jgi:hypothetical protein